MFTAVETVVGVPKEFTMSVQKMVLVEKQKDRFSALSHLLGFPSWVYWFVLRMWQSSFRGPLKFMHSSQLELPNRNLSKRTPYSILRATYDLLRSTNDMHMSSVLEQNVAGFVTLTMVQYLEKQFYSR